MIVRYLKHVDAIRTTELALPMAGADRLGTELATIDGLTYVHIPAGAKLPPQAADIAPEPVELTPELARAIKTASPHVRLIHARVVAKIRERYSVDDEFQMLRLPDTPEAQAYRAYTEACVAWGKQEKARLGL